jgi:hypothetical protein
MSQYLAFIAYPQKMNRGYQQIVNNRPACQDAAQHTAMPPPLTGFDTVKKDRLQAE